MTKKEIRKKYLEMRKTLSNDEVLSFSKQIFENFIANFKIQEGQKIHIFISVAKFNEVQTVFFISHFLKNNVQVFLPKMTGDDIVAVPFTKDTKMKVNSWGIAEPVSDEDAGITDFDYVITPLLYCNAEGNRVGFGKGYYDRFFAKINPGCKKIGVGFYPPDEKVDDVSPTDVPLDYLVTPVDVLSFGTGTSKFTK